MHEAFESHASLLHRFVLQPRGESRKRPLVVPEQGNMEVLLH